MGCCKVKEEKKIAPFGEGNLSSTKNPTADNHQLLNQIQDPTSRGETKGGYSLIHNNENKDQNKKTKDRTAVDTQQALINVAPNSDHPTEKEAYKEIKQDEKTLQNQELITLKQNTSVSQPLLQQSNYSDNNNNSSITKHGGGATGKQRDMEETQNISGLNTVENDPLKKDQSIIFHQPQNHHKTDSNVKMEDVKLPEIGSGRILNKQDEEASDNFVTLSARNIEDAKQSINNEQVPGRQSKDEIKKERDRIKNAVSHRSQQPNSADREIAQDYINSLFSTVQKQQQYEEKTIQKTEIMPQKQKLEQINEVSEERKHEQSSSQLHMEHSVTPSQINIEQRASKAELVEIHPNQIEEEVKLQQKLEEPEPIKQNSHYKLKEQEQQQSKHSEERPRQSNSENNSQQSLSNEEMVAKDYISKLFKQFNEQFPSYLTSPKGKEEPLVVSEERGDDIVNDYIKELRKSVIDQLPKP